MDLAGGTFAAAHASKRVVTVRIDAVEFLKSVSVGDDVSVFCALEDEENTSVAVRIEVGAQVRTGDAPHKVTEGVFRYVAVTEDGKPTSSSQAVTSANEPRVPHGSKSPSGGSPCDADHGGRETIMSTSLTARFDTRREAEIMVDRLVQQSKIERTDVFITADGDDNTTGVEGVGWDTEAGEPSPESRDDAELISRVVVSLDIEDYGLADEVRSAFTEFDAAEVEEG